MTALFQPNNAMAMQSVAQTAGWRVAGPAPATTRHTRRCVVRRHVQTTRAAAGSATATPASSAEKSQVLQLLSSGQHSFYSQSPAMTDAITRLLEAGSPTLTPGDSVSQGMGVGTWQVFWAPHISSMSSTLGAKFEPILYKFRADGSLVSNVKYTSPVLGTGWLSASGRMFKRDESTVEISFDTFWMDFGEDALREELPGGDLSGTVNVLGIQVPLDSLLTSLGRATFFPQLALFPVAWMDEDLAVFEFPPLSSKIAISRIDDQPGDANA